MRLPVWFEGKTGIGSPDVKRLLRKYGLSTVCEEARCPNQKVCFSKPTATFMILGSSCTRNCGFCSVSSFNPEPLDPYEPERIVDAARELGLKYVVITSPTRDDLPDGGADHFARTIRLLKDNLNIKVEVLTPDFQGDYDALKIVLEAGPDVFSHNLETVPRLYPVVRAGADYKSSLSILDMAGRLAPHIYRKSGMMLGFGETQEEVISLMRDLRDIDCDAITIGQYLRPGKDNLPVYEYITPEVFDKIKELALEFGFKFIASGPLVRSSFNAEEICGD